MEIFHSSFLAALGFPTWGSLSFSMVINAQLDSRQMQMELEMICVPKRSCITHKKTKQTNKKSIKYALLFFFFFSYRRPGKTRSLPIKRHHSAADRSVWRDILPCRTHPSTPPHLKGKPARPGTSSNSSVGTKPTLTMTQVSFEVNLKVPEQDVHSTKANAEGQPWLEIQKEEMLSSLSVWLLCPKLQ